MNVRIIIVLSLLLFTYCCNENKKQLVRTIVYKWEVKREKEQGIFLVEDTVVDNEYLYLEKAIKLEEHVIDSLLRNNVISDRVYIDSFLIIIDTIFNREIDGELTELAKINFAIIKDGYYVTTIYGKNIGLLIKDYHGHGRCLLSEVEYLQNGNVITTMRLAEFSKSLIEDNRLFPDLPAPPPPPLPVYK